MMKRRHLSRPLAFLLIVIMGLAGWLLAENIPYGIGLCCLFVWTVLGINLTESHSQKIVFGMGLALSLRVLLYPPFVMGRHSLIGGVEFASLFHPPLDEDCVAPIAGLMLGVIEFFLFAITSVFLLSFRFWKHHCRWQVVGTAMGVYSLCLCCLLSESLWFQLTTIYLLLFMDGIVGLTAFILWFWRE